MKLIPGEGLKPLGGGLAGRPGWSAPNEANPWRGIETSQVRRCRRPGVLAPNEANPWRGIETKCRGDPVAYLIFPPNEANPWRGIETLDRCPTGTSSRQPRMKLIPGEGLKRIRRIRIR